MSVQDDAVKRHKNTKRCTEVGLLHTCVCAEHVLVMLVKPSAVHPPQLLMVHTEQPAHHLKLSDLSPHSGP